jgi:hypothetical protein
MMRHTIAAPSEADASASTRNETRNPRVSIACAIPTPAGLSRKPEEGVMKGLLLTAALSAAGLAGLGNFGMRAPDVRTPELRAQDLSADEDTQQAGVFGQWLRPNAPECVPVSDIASVSRLTSLTPEQFQFVRALYIAIPPVSRELPPGDSAIVASANGKAMVALVADGRTCARFLAPDFILSMLVQVGRGETGEIGEPI